MSNSLLPINSKAHASHGYSVPKDFSFTKNNSVSVVLIDELPSLLSIYPLGFAKISEDSFALVALHGLYNKENIFLNEDARWLARYIPNIYKTYPFALVDETLCFDMESKLYRETPDLDSGDRRFFDDNGNPTEMTKKILSSLSEVNKYRAVTIKAVQAIVKADILEPWTLNIENPNPEKLLIQGLYRVNEKKLAALDAEQLKQLQTSNAISLVYAQIFSMPRINILKQLHDMKNKKQQKTQEEEINLDAFFGEGSSDTISFDW